MGRTKINSTVLVIKKEILAGKQFPVFWKLRSEKFTL
jgi:hypothetical protein